MEASRETLGETNGPLLSEKEMRDELAADVAKGKKGLQDTGCRALQRIKRAAEEDVRPPESVDDGAAALDTFFVASGLLIGYILHRSRGDANYFRLFRASVCGSKG